MEEGARPPRWGVWDKMPQVTILQAVALSLDIEPNQIRFSRNGWLHGPSDRPSLDESQEFEDRLTVVLGNAPSLTTNRSPTSQTRVALNAFVDLATVFGWTMPAALRKLNEKASTMALSNAASCNEWPAHTTKKLEALKAAAREWWSTYDATRPKYSANNG